MIEISASAPADPPPSTDAGETRQFLSFVVDGRSYGVGIEDIREIRQWMRATPLPNQPPHVLGVLNLRGTIVPIQDLRIRFGAPAPDPVETNVIVIVQVESRRIGLLVDAVSDILTLSEADIQSIPLSRGSGADAMLRALAVSSDAMVGIIDLDRIMEPSTPDPQDA